MTKRTMTFEFDIEKLQAALEKHQHPGTLGAPLFRVLATGEVPSADDATLAMYGVTLSSRDERGGP